MSQGQGYYSGAPTTYAAPTTYGAPTTYAAPMTYGAHLSPRFQAMPTMMHVYHSNPANQGEEDSSEGNIMTQPPQLSPVLRP